MKWGKANLNSRLTSYDANGNITKIVDGNKITNYYYDDLGQLIREDNTYDDHSYTYEYDGNGNITSKKTYAYTTDILGSVEDTITYCYGNSDWKDSLFTEIKTQS